MRVTLRPGPHLGREHAETESSGGAEGALEEAAGGRHEFYCEVLVL